MIKRKISLIGDYIYSIKTGLTNLIKWTPTIWKDRDWDQWYLYEIFKKKLSHMEKFQREYGNSIDSKKIAFQIKTCVLLLDRLIKDDYDEMVFKKHNKKWGEMNLEFQPFKIGLYKGLISRPNIKTEKDMEKERREFRRLSEHEKMLRKQDIDYLFKLMNKHIQKWWD